MKLKNILVSLAISSLVVLSSCFTNEEDPTIFSGWVIYEDDGAPYNQGSIIVQCFSGFPGTLQGFERESLNESNEFFIRFESSEDINTYSIAVSADNLEVFTQASGLLCPENDCDEFRPGGRYTDLIIQVPRQ